MFCTNYYFCCLVAYFHLPPRPLPLLHSLSLSLTVPPLLPPDPACIFYDYDYVAECSFCISAFTFSLATLRWFVTEIHSPSPLPLLLWCPSTPLALMTLQLFCACPSVYFLQPLFAVGMQCCFCAYANLWIFSWYPRNACEANLWREKDTHKLIERERERERARERERERVGERALCIVQIIASHRSRNYLHWLQWRLELNLIKTKFKRNAQRFISIDVFSLIFFYSINSFFSTYLISSTALCCDKVKNLKKKKRCALENCMEKLSYKYWQRWGGEKEWKEKQQYAR